MSLRLRRKSFLALALAATSIGVSSNLHAASGTWNGTALDGLWTTAGNWNGNIIADGSGNTGDLSQVDLLADQTVTLNADRTISSIIFGDQDTSTIGNWVIASGNTLTLDGGTPTITVNPLGTGATATINAVIAGTSGLAKTGTGTLILSGANTYSGGTTVDNGALTLSATGLLGSGPLSFTNTGSTATITLNSSQSIGTLSAVNSGASTNTLTVASGTTLAVNESASTTFGAILAGSGAISQTGPGILSLNQINTYTGTYTVNGGGLTLDMSGTNFTSTSQLSLPTGARIAVGGATFLFKIGSLTAVQEQVNFTVNSGHSTLNSQRGSGGRIVAKLASPVRNVGGTANMAILNTGSSGNNWRMPVTANVNGVVPFVTVLNNDFFAANSTGLNGDGTAYSSYTASTATTLGTSTQNSNIVTDVAVPAATTVNTLRYNDGSSRTVTIGSSDTLNIATGAILITNTAANHKLTITGGNIAGGNPGSSSGLDLIFMANNNPTAGSNAVTVVNSTIVDNTGGATAFTKSGIGYLRLTNAANTYTGKNYLNGGLVQIAGEGASFGSLGAVPGSVVADQITMNGGGIQWASSFDLNSNRGITINQNGATFDTNGFNTTFAGQIVGVGGVTKVGSGIFTVTANNTYAGGTSVTAGTLAVNNTTGSGTGSGAISVGTAGTLTGSGTMTGTVTTVAGATLVPGNAGIGTMTVGGLTMASSAVFNFEFPASGTTSDLINITGANGLTLNGGNFNIYAAGTTNNYTHAGAFKLFQYSGAIQGTGIGALTTANILNPQGGLTYSFDTSTNPGFVTLVIGGSVATISQWAADADGNWSTAGNWTPAVVPQNAGDTANFTTTLSTVGRTVTLDGSRTVGTIVFDSGSANGYTIGVGSGSLTLDNGGPSSSVNVNNISANPATHTISVPTVLVGNANISVNNVATNFLAITGNLSGSGTITKSGVGVLALSGNNSYGPAAGSVGTTLSAGTIQFGSNTALGAGDLLLTGSATIQASANASLANNIIVTAGFGATVDTQANAVSLGGVISQTGSSGALTKTGTGTLTLTGNSTYSGTTTVSAGKLIVDNATGSATGSGGVTVAASGTLAIGTGGTNGAVTGNIASSGAVILNHAGPYTFSNVLSGSGSLTSSGTGTTTIGSANTFTGDTVVTSGTLELGIGTGLQSSTLNYDNQGGTISFGTQPTVTLGNLKGSQSLALVESDTTTPVALTVGNTSATTTNTYSGALSGPGTLTKAGAGTLVLTGTSTLPGTTTVTQGTLSVGSGGVLNVNSIDITPATTTTLGTGSAVIVIDGGSLTATATSTFRNGSSSAWQGQFALNSGTATFANLNLSTDNQAQATNAGKWVVANGTLTANNVVIGRNGIGANGVEVAGSDNSRGFILGTASGGVTATGVGSVTINGSLTMGGASTSTNSTVQLNLNSGTMSVAGPILVGLNNAARWSDIDVNGATFNSTDTTTGLTLVSQTTTPGNAVLLVRNGTANVAKITMGEATVTASPVALVNLIGGTLNVGAGGINTGSSSVIKDVRMGNGTLGAAADWSSDSGVTYHLGGTAAFSPTIRADNGAVTPVAHNIAINGVVADATTNYSATPVALVPAVALNKTGAGTLAFNANNTFTAATNVNGGTLAYGASQSNVSGGINVAAGATAGIIAKGSSNVIDAQPDLVNGGGDPSGYVPGDKYVITNTLSLTGTGKFDVNDGILVVNNGDFTTLNAAIHSHTIMSTTVNYDSDNLFGLTAVGWADNFDTGYAGISATNQLTISGSLIPAATDFAQQFIFKYTYFGDLNLDGKVTNSDFDLVLNTLGNTTNQITGNPVAWFDGDFNGNGVIDTSDLSTVINSFGYGTPSNTQPPLVPGTSVPEPSSVVLMLLGLGGAAAVVRRKK